jgi:paired amphipathic helix protein Sin3a
MLTFADNNNSADFAKVVPFIKEFVPLFFGIDAAKFEQRVQTSPRDTPNDSGEDTPSPDDDVSQRSQKMKKGDLRRNVLDPNNKSRKDKEDSVASASRDSTPDASAMDEEAAGDSSNSNPRADRPERQWVEYTEAPTAFGDKEFDHEEPYQRVEYNMYSNASIYCFFRMFVMLYERLWKLKDSEEEVREVIARAKEPKAAQKLKMLDKQPDDFFKDTSPSANYYQQLLEMFQDQISGEVEMNFIEETLRRYYLQIGWQLYSFDRLLSSLVRFALAVVSHDNKDKSLDIYNLFRKDRVNDTTTHKNEISYRKAVEKFAKDADTYRITYVSQQYVHVMVHVLTSYRTPPRWKRTCVSSRRTTRPLSLTHSTGLSAGGHTSPLTWPWSPPRKSISLVSTTRTLRSVWQEPKISPRSDSTTSSTATRSPCPSALPPTL